MEFGVKSATASTLKAHCLVLGIYQGGKMHAATQEADDACGNLISDLVKQKDIKGGAGETTWLYNVEGLQSARILLVGCGKPNELQETQFNKVVDAAAQALKKSHVKDAAWFISDIEVKDRDLLWCTRQATQRIVENFYTFDQLKSKKDTEQPTLKKVIWAVSNAHDQKAAETGSTQGNAVALGTSLAKDLGNLPGNVCTPGYLEQQAKSLDSEYAKITTKVLEEKEMEQLGMGALLSVSKGSREPAKLIIMQYNGGKKGDKPLVLVGKGLTFDAGGISLKPSEGMDEMKYDMCGAASVFGTMKAVAELKLPVNLIGVVPSSENLPDGQANKPGDIVTSLSGQTIEILNTDAEGRLILCDALTYVERFEPKAVVDIATLTGACVIALGGQASGMFSNNEKLAHELQDAAQQSFDRIWQLPLWDEYQDQLKSNFADMANIGGRQAGTITAACFLSRYTKKYKWAHLDIAGTAWKSGAEKGATGRPVPLLTQWVLNHCGK